MARPPGDPETTCATPTSPSCAAGFADISNFVVAQHREGAVLGYRYPGQFKDHIVEGADGERIAASIALQEAARPALIVVHGLFTSSRFDYVRQIAVRAFYEWGFNVAALDLRSFGMTELTSPAPSTAGWKEGLDILALARYMKELGSTSVGALGISLGGSSVLNACDQEETPTDARRRHPRGLAAGGAEARLGSASPSRSPGPSPLSAPPRLRGGADLPGALGPLAAGGRGHGAGDGARLGALLRRQRPRRSGPSARGHRQSRTRRCRCSSCIPRTTTIVKVEQARMLAEAAQGQRPGPRLDPARRLARAARGGRSALDPRRLPDLLRALGDLCGAHRPRRPTGRAPSWFTPRRSPGSAYRERRAKHGQRNLEATDLGGLAGGHGRAGDRRRAPALRGDLAPRLQRGAARVTDGERHSAAGPAAATRRARLRRRQRRQGPSGHGRQGAQRT